MDVQEGLPIKSKGLLEKIVDGSLIELFTGLGLFYWHQSTIYKLMDRAGVYDVLAYFQSNPPIPIEFLNDYESIITVETLAGASLAACGFYVTNKTKKYLMRRLAGSDKHL